MVYNCPKILRFKQCCFTMKSQVLQFQQKVQANLQLVQSFVIFVRKQESSLGGGG